MKRKIFTTLLVLIMICSPLMFMTGCGADPSGDTHFKVSADTIEVAKGTSFASYTGLTVQLDYKLQKWNQEQGEYWYVVQNSDNNDGSTLYDFAETNEPVWFYGGDSARATEISLNDALAEGMSYSGWNTTTVGTGKKLTLTFGGVTHEVTYSVVEK